MASETKMGKLCFFQQIFVFFLENILQDYED